MNKAFALTNCSDFVKGSQEMSRQGWGVSVQGERSQWGGPRAARVTVKIIKMQRKGTKQLGTKGASDWAAGRPDTLEHPSKTLDSGCYVLLC